MRTALGLALSFILIGNAVAAEELLPVLQSNDVRVDMLAHSWGHDNNESNGSFKMTMPDDEDYFTAKISDRTCSKGSGKLYLRSLVTDKTDQLDYVKGTNTAGGRIGGVLCATYDHLKKQGKL